MSASTTAAAGTELELLTDQLRRIQAGEAWHGPSVAEALAGCTAAQAGMRPVSGGHTISEIVYHLRVVEDGVRRRLAGESESSESDWSARTDASPSGWRDSVNQLVETQRTTLEAVTRLSPDRLHAPLPGKDSSAWFEIMGLIQHNAYHAGQISLLRKGG
jgi:uncharacterized damage-inducible protein DinB